MFLIQTLTHTSTKKFILVINDGTKGKTDFFQFIKEPSIKAETSVLETVYKTDSKEEAIDHLSKLSKKNESNQFFVSAVNPLKENKKAPTKPTKKPKTTSKTSSTSTSTYTEVNSKDSDKKS